jgi:hypothetical protein
VLARAGATARGGTGAESGYCATGGDAYVKAKACVGARCKTSIEEARSDKFC